MDPGAALTPREAAGGLEGLAGPTSAARRPHHAHRSACYMFTTCGLSPHWMASTPITRAAPGCVPPSCSPPGSSPRARARAGPADLCQEALATSGVPLAEACPARTASQTASPLRASCPHPPLVDPRGWPRAGVWRRWAESSGGHDAPWGGSSHLCLAPSRSQPPACPPPPPSTQPAASSGLHCPPHPQHGL